MKFELDSSVEEVLIKAGKGKEISKRDALKLMRVVDNDFQALCIVANEARKNIVGDDVTFVFNRNINFTNTCKSNCKFCNYRVDKGFLLSMEEILDKCRIPGITEVCIQGGLNPEISLDYYTSILKSIKGEYPSMHIHAFSPAEVWHMVEKEGIGLKETLTILKESGLGSMPGTAAEILNDEIRSIICPNKIDTETWIKIIKTAHKLKIPTTSTLMYGHIESPEDRVDHILLLRKIQRETNGFTEFVPLSYINKNPLGEEYGLGGALGQEDVILTAVSRLLLMDTIPNIQTSWVKLGKKLAQIMLMCGANDLGGTLFEESISRASGGIQGEYMPIDEMERMVGPLGRTLRQRDTLYNLI